MVSVWTSAREAAEIEAVLQAAGIPCHRCSTGAEVYANPQLQARGTFPLLEHPDLGHVPVEAARHRLSRTPALLPVAAPAFGQHNNHVLGDILGMSDDEIIELTAAGAIE
jgi:crotonobetainyl-CoA:carnitine CoA-transferase CaiB-like acyl-CoA transferase